MPLRTPLYQQHLAAQARMIDFAGWEMPVQYRGVLEEHATVRERVGLFDVSHMGEIAVSGNDAVSALNTLFTNDLGACRDGQAQYGCLCRHDGGVIDDVIVYRHTADKLLVCVNASNRQKDFDWIADHLKGRAQMSVRDESDQWAQLALQGPLAARLMARLNPSAPALTPFHFFRGEVGGVDCLVARTGYTGEDGFELFCSAAAGPQLWEALTEEGRQEGIAPAGLGARDVLRLEAAYRLYGSDMDDGTTPIEAGLGWIVKVEKGPFLGREVLATQKRDGPPKKLIGFELTGPGIARRDHAVVHQGKEVGAVTSGTRSPSLGTSIGLAYVPAALAVEGTELAVVIRGREVTARVVKTPFYRARKSQALGAT